MLAKTVHNDPSRLVDESLEGLLLTRPDLVLVPPAHLRVVARRALDATKVAVVCGGGAGHEPAHAGFVGEGMLTAAVTGDIFASPTVAAVEHALVAAAGGRAAAASGGRGVLLVVKNYTGDRLAFAAAAQKARLLGVPVETVYVCDDAALEGGAGRRGLAGAVLVYKIAGALAEAGFPLAVVAGAARAAAAQVATFGASLTACEIPGRVPSDRLAGAACELGLGIHGEPGATRLAAVPSADALAAAALAPLAAAIRGARAPGSTVPCALLVNNYGGLSPLELGGVVRAAVAWLDAQPPAAPGAPPRLHLARLISGTLVTSLAMRGFSLSLLPLGPLLPDAAVPSAEALLDAPAPLTAWPRAAAPPPGGCGRICLAGAAAPAQPPAGAAALPAALAAAGGGAAAGAAALLAALEAAAAALLGAEAALNALDARVGDGDTGSTFAAAARAALAAAAPALRAAAAAPAAPAPAPAAAARALAAPAARAIAAALLSDVADALAAQCGGTSGLLYALMLRAAAVGAAAPGGSLAAAFAGALRAVGAAANSREGQRSMLDALGPAARALEACAGPLDAAALAAVAAAARAGAEATAEMAPAVGRASWVAPELARGVQDAGAAAAALWVGAVAHALKPYT
jgi:dihydroxyacetone kinase